MGPEQRVAGRYRLIRELGAGGFGQVWRARDEKLDIDVAVKKLRVDLEACDADRAKAVARAEAEARHAAALRDHPNVVAVHDIVTDQGTPWLVMRLVDGWSLADDLARRGRLSPEQAALIAGGVLSALDAAHQAGIVHRDVKPANIMITADGQVLLADFGIAKHPSDTALTSTGMVIGSIEYMPPERLGSSPEANGPAGDLFSLGATLYEAVEGVSPFRRDSVMATMSAVAFEPHAPMRHAGPLAPLIEALLVKQPSERADIVRAKAILYAAGGAGVPEVPETRSAERVDISRTKSMPRAAGGAGVPQAAAVGDGGTGRVIKQGFANHWRGLEAVGGRLTVTSTEVIFKPHRFNLQRGEARWSRSDIGSVTKGSRFNEVEVAMADGTVERFVVYGRKKWLAALASRL